MTLAAFAVIFALSGIILTALASLKMILIPYPITQVPPGNVSLVQENCVSPVILAPTINPRLHVVYVEIYSTMFV
jgi:hypothetical protein